MPVNSHEDVLRGHTISVGKVLAWLDGGAKSPSEQVKKNRLKERLRR